MNCTRPLYHGIYTNAFDRRGQGFRNLFISPDWPASDQQRVGQWLQALQPAAGADPRFAWATGCFRIARTIHACLARVDGDFAHDEHGRGGGVLAHALLTPLDETQSPHDFGRALLRIGGQLRRPRVADTDKLEAYLEQCQARLEVSVPPIDIEANLSLTDEFLARFLTITAERPQSIEVAFDVDSSTELVEMLTRASGLLPPRLRLACRWGVGLRTTAGLAFLARPTGAAAARHAGAPPRSSARGDGVAYLRWLRRQKRPDETLNVIDDWNIRNWQGLAQ